MSEEWFEETLYGTLRTRLKVDKVLYEGKSEHQHLLLFENGTFGRVLTLNGVVQTTERDEFVYHEMLAHVPILAHGRASHVLIIGGGDGGMLEEVLKHRSVERATMIEIDGDVVEFSKRHLRSICGDAFEDPRLDLVIADGIEYVETTTERFDVIIVDSTDPIGPGEVLFTPRFYAHAKRCLNPGGVLVTQNGVPFMQPEELRTTVRNWRALFRDAGCFLASVSLYVGGPMALGWATDDTALRNMPLDTIAKRFEAAGIQTRYYNPAVHVAAFALPGYVQDLLRD